MLGDFRQDFSHALRGLVARPAFSAAVVVTLALGIGANAAMFSVVDQLLFRSPPLLENASSVRRVYTFLTLGGKETLSRGGYAVYSDLAKGTSSFERTAAFVEQDLAVGAGDGIEEKPIGIVSSNFFDFFNAPPVIGRVFSPAEDMPPTGAPVAVASYATWQTAFNGRRDVLGSTVQIGSVVYTVIGVMPPLFAGVWQSRPPAYLIPMARHFSALDAANPPFLRRETWWTTHRWGSVQMMARMKPAVSDAAASADVTRAFFNSTAAADSRGAKGAEVLHPRAIVASVVVERGPEGSSAAKVAVWLGGVALAVLLVACASVANLLVARALNRRREIAIRLALGVSMRRLFFQLLMESGLLALAGGAAGILLAQWTSVGLRGALLPGDAGLSVWRDARTLLFAGAAVLAVGVLTGLAPIVHARRADVAKDLKAGADARTYRRSRLRTALVVLQLALSVLLLVGAGLFVRSLEHVRSVRLGYDVDPILIVRLNQRGASFDDGQQVELRRRLLVAAKTLANVENASLALGVPFYNAWRDGLFLPGATTPVAGEFELSAVSPEYFRTMGTRIVRGRGIEELDGPNAPLVAVISESMAATLWPGKNPVGQCIGVGRLPDPCTFVVGVAEDIKAHGLDKEPVMYYYLPAAQYHPEFTRLLVRARGDASGSTETVRRALQREMPGASYVTVTPFSDVIGGETRSWRLGATVFTAFGGLALVIAAIGLYSVIMYNVAQRTHELAVRTALGAHRSDVVRLVVLEGFRLGVAGVMIGGAMALAAGHWVEPLLFQESPRDALVFALVAGALVLVTAIASWLPAHRAARIEPLTALRYE